MRATRTAAALETIAGHLQGIPGRKTLIWISGGFPIQLGLRNSVDTTPQSNQQPARQRASGSRRAAGRECRSAATAANRAATSREFIGAILYHKLPGTGRSFESDVARAIRALNEADVAVYPVDARGVTVAAAFQADRSSIGKRSKPPKAFGRPISTTKRSKRWPRGTGGRAFHHINDLSAAIQHAARRLSEYCPISRVQTEQNRYIMFYAKGLPDVPS